MQSSALLKETAPLKTSPDHCASQHSCTQGANPGMDPARRRARTGVRTRLADRSVSRRRRAPDSRASARVGPSGEGVVLARVPPAELLAVLALADDVADDADHEHQEGQ